MGILVKMLIGVILNGGILYALTYLIPEIIYTGGFKFFVVGGIILGLYNLLIRPVIKIISLPFVMFTGGIFVIASNVFILWAFAYLLNTMDFQGITLAFPNWGTYVIGAVVFGVINWFAHLLIK